MKSGKKWLLIAGMAGLLPAAVAVADDSTGNNNAVPTAAPSMPVAPIGESDLTIPKLHQINQMEIKAGQLAQRHGESARVKQYAAQMVRDHQSADRQVMAYAKKHKIDIGMQASAKAENKLNATTPEAADDPAMQAEMTRLESLKGAELDRAFLTAMVSGHDQAIAMVRSASAATSDRDLSGLLNQLLPTLQKHRDMAATLLNGLHGTSMK